MFIEIQGVKTPINAVEFQASLDSEPAILFSTNAGLDVVPLGAGVKMLDRAGAIVMDSLTAERLDPDRCRLQCGQPLPKPNDEPPLIHLLTQRTVNEPLDEFLNRYLHGRIVSANGEDGDLKDLEKAFLPHACLLQGCKAPPHQRWGKARSLLAAQSPSFAGWSRLLGRFWRARFFHAAARDPNWRVELNSGQWRTASQPETVSASAAACWVEARWRALDGQTKEFLSKLPTSQRYKVGELEFPILPTTINLGDRWFFAASICIRVSFTAKAPEPDFFVWVGLSPDRPSPAITDLGMTSLRVAGRFLKWSDDGKTIQVTPPTAEQLVEAGLTGFPVWAVSGPNRFLTAYLLTPGFSREQYSALYARLEEGDWIALQVDDGQAPLALGSLQMRRQPFEDKANAAVVISATAFLTQAVDAAGKSVDTSIALSNAGSVAVSAQKAVELQKNVTITQSKSDFAKDVAIKTALDVG